MNPGKLDRFVTVEKRTTTKDSTYHSDQVTWTPLVPTDADPTVGVRFAAQLTDALPSKSESVQQGLAVGANQSRLRMRYRNDIDSSMRIIVHGDGDVIYQIAGGPAMIGRRELIELVLEKFSTQGE